jgi:HAD superfamily hydrolase (TIGR01509 family)
MSTRPLGFDLVIFDCDGVLVDSEVLACRCLAEVLGRHGAGVTLDVVFEKFLGRSVAAVGDHFRTLGGEMPADFTTELWTVVRTCFAQSLQPMPGIEQVLRRLEPPACVASSSDRERLQFTLEVTDLSRHFAGRTFTAQMVKNGKPAPDLFLHAAAAVGAEPARTLVVEDTVIGVAAGKAAGMTVWGFTGGSHCIGRDVPALLARAGADRIFDHMAEFWPRPTEGR